VAQVQFTLDNEIKFKTFSPFFVVIAVIEILEVFFSRDLLGGGEIFRSHSDWYWGATNFLYNGY
jgi:hypothetical protein